MKSLLVLIIASGIIITACNSRPKRIGWKDAKNAVGENSSPISNPAPNETGDMAVPTPGLDLVWKRYRAFEHGLVQGLVLNKKDFCLELGKQACIDVTHLTVLGGNEPYKAGQYERAQAPTVLSAIAVDRVVISACSQRLELDRKAGAAAKVFKHFALDGKSVEKREIEALASDLYQRILARNAEPAELKVIAQFGDQGLPNDKVALMMCYAIASSSENILL